MAMQLIRVIATDPHDKTKAQRTRREHLCNAQEAAETEARYHRVGMVTTRQPETVG